MYALESFPDGRRIRFSANLPLLDRAVEEAVRFVQGHRVTGNLFDVKLLLREALLNAVLHGSHSDPKRDVSLEVLADAGQLRLTVTDQGPGFDWRAGLSTLAPPEATTGRGLTIMSLYADDVRFNAVGNQVTLTKAITGLQCTADADDKNQTRRNVMHDIHIENGQTIVCPAGDIVASVAEELRTRLKEIMREHPGPLVLDLSHVELIDSVGIGLLIAAHNTLRKRGGQLLLSHVNADLAALLRTMRLDRHFSIQPA